jgi:hypothetical protein
LRLVALIMREISEPELKRKIAIRLRLIRTFQDAQTSENLKPGGTTQINLCHDRDHVYPGLLGIVLFIELNWETEITMYKVPC